MSARKAAEELAVVSDERVVLAVKDGSEPAFGVLYDRYRDRSHRLARSVCRNEDRAEEAVQDAFISIWATRASYDAPAGTVASWPLTIVRYGELTHHEIAEYPDLPPGTVKGPIRLGLQCLRYDTSASRPDAVM